MLKSLYLGPLGIFISVALNVYSRFVRPFMVYGYFDWSKLKFQKNTRISSTATIIDKSKLEIEDNCWIWHHSIIDASNGVAIGEGCQIGAFVGIFSHSSHVSIRLYGASFINTDSADRIGYVRDSVSIGSYTFIGAGALILPGSVIGRGCIVSAGAIVKGVFPDYSIIAGNPAKVIGEVGKIDSKFLNNPVVEACYFDQDYLECLKRQSQSVNNNE